jgi:hypothetical protein
MLEIFTQSQEKGAILKVFFKIAPFLILLKIILKLPTA